MKEDMFDPGQQAPKDQSTWRQNSSGVPLPTGKIEADHCHWSRRKVYKNLFLLSLGLFFLTSAYKGTTSLQSTMNSKGGVGVVSEALVCASYGIASLFLPNYVIERWGLKRPFAIGMLLACPYMASNFYPHWASFVPASIVWGFGSSVVWTASSSYVNELSFLSSLQGTVSCEFISAKFFGIFEAFFYFSYVWGNLLSYVILELNALDSHSLPTNSSAFSCGAEFCGLGEGVNPNLREPSNEKRYHLTAAYLVSALLSVLLVTIALDEPARNQKSKTEGSAALRGIFPTISNMRQPKQLLMMPMAFYVGIADGFYFSDFTRAYIACSWDVFHVGHVTISYGVMCTLSSTLTGLLTRCVGRIPIFLVAATVNACAFVFLLKWVPNSSEPTAYFLLAGMWGFFIAVFQSLTLAIYGFLFREDEDAAFSNNHLWTTLGMCVSFAWSDFLCTTTKVYILASVLALSLVGYALMEVKLRSERKACIDNSK